MQKENTRPETQQRLSAILPGAWVGYNLLTAHEAQQLQEEATKRGMTHVELTAGDNSSKEGCVTDARLRDCTRCTMECPELAARVWERLRPHLARTIIVDGSEDCRLIGLPSDDEHLHGRWKPYGVNPCFRICRYPGAGRGHFGPHQDSAVEKSSHNRSLLTVNGYLNELPEGVGGCTRFLIDELGMHQDERGRFTVKDAASSVRGTIRPEAPGMAAVFFHKLMHDSEPLSENAPPKWIWRTEVMFMRDPATARKLNPKDELARLIERSAERIERSEPMAAVQLYQLGQRLRDGRISHKGALARYELLRPDSSGEGEYSESDVLETLKEKEVAGL
mmetsp:Transcript_31863/g.83306  ORF Transcript_31863/g.83306 Transcript_31863/m.83306 type:complete len:335 (+) Transcript_31863:68-1072(+)